MPLHSPLVAFTAITNPAKARAFYCDLLCLHLLKDTPFAPVGRTFLSAVRGKMPVLRKTTKPE